VNPLTTARRFFARRLPNRADAFAIRLAYKRFCLNLLLPNAATDEIARQVMFVSNLALHVAPRTLSPNLPKPVPLRESLQSATTLRPQRSYHLPPGTPLIDIAAGDAQLSVTQRTLARAQERPT
jgi:hypothetical protein